MATRTDNQRKRRKNDKEKKKARKDRKAAAKASEEAGGVLPGGAEVKSNSRAGRFSPIKPKRLYSKHNHKFKREHVTALKVLTTDDKYLELVISCCGFMVEAKKVDEMFVFKPVDPKNTDGEGGEPCPAANQLHKFDGNN